MEDTKLTEYKADTWYWFTHKHEGNVWYPIFYDGQEFVLDGERINSNKLQGLNIEKSIMPGAPTCTPNERKFLDRVKEIGELSPKGNILFPDVKDHGKPYIHRDLFKGINLSEILGKKE